MAAVIYIFDTNAIADLLRAHANMVARVRLAQADNIFGLCQPVDYEVQRGLLWKAASRQHEVYLRQIKPQFAWINLTNADWQRAAELWAATRQKGRQLSDVDLLLAAVAGRLDGVIVSSDNDFDTLNIRRENWREG